MKRILVGLDGSPQADGVLAAAIELARQLQSRLILLHACSLPVGVPLEVYALSPDALPEVLEREARRTLEAQSRQVPRELLEGLRVVTGVAWQQLCEVARLEDVDLVVIGSHGYGGLDRLLGTTAARVVNHADRSVLVLRPAHTEHHDRRH